MPRPKRQTRSERLNERAAAEAAEVARKEARAQWIADNPEAHAAEQKAIAETQAERIAHLEGE